MPTGPQRCQVAIRVRPFSEQENADGATRVLEVKPCADGSRTLLVDPEAGEKRAFRCDFVFPSLSDIGQLANQEAIMERVGVPALDAAMQGRHATILVCGAAGAGKTHTVVGEGHPPGREGLLPRVCRELLRRSAAEATPASSYAVELQVYEIYCEQGAV
eukprot:EG_transcript_37063